MVGYKQAMCGLVGLAFVLLTGCSGPAYNKAGGPVGSKPLVLTLANPYYSSDELDGFVSRVSRLSNGAIKIDVRSGWAHGQNTFESRLIRDVRAGKADLGVVGSYAWDLVGVRTFRALDAPLLIDSYPLEERVVRSRMTDKMLLGLKPLGLVGVGVLPGPLRRPLGITHPLLKPSDYGGLIFGVTHSRLQGATLRALGAEPVWLFPSDGSLAGLDGLETYVSAVEAYQWDGEAKYLTANVVLWPRPLTLFANGKEFAALSASQRRILRRAAAEDVGPETNFVRDNELQDTATLCRARQLQFLTASRTELAALRRAVEPVYVQLRSNSPQTRTYLAQIKALARGVPPEALACAAIALPASGTSLLDGVYRFTTSAADLRAAGAQPTEVVPENYGSWTIVIDRGRFALAQEDRRACTWAYGNLAVKPKTLELSITNGGGIAPTGSTDKPGELWTYTWSLDRDILSLGRAGAVSPTPTMAKPWRRIASSPSSRFFSSRCPPPPQALPR
jgi:TRAP-type C4-dicarboxylate transport system substrate-binding protein